MSEHDAPLADHSMLELFRMEVDQHTAVLTDGLLRLEEGPAGAEQIEPLMRAAHSVKGAARLVGIADAVELAHLMEDVLVSAQKGERVLDAGIVDVMLKGVDMVILVAELSEHPGQQLTAAQQTEYDGLLSALRAIMKGDYQGADSYSESESSAMETGPVERDTTQAVDAGQPAIVPPAEPKLLGDDAAADAMMGVFRN